MFKEMYIVIKEFNNLGRQDRVCIYICSFGNYESHIKSIEMVA